MTKTKLTLFVILLLSPLMLFAQGGEVIGVSQSNVQGYNRIISGATITACTYTGSLLCPSPLTIYSDSGLTVPLGTSMFSDINGNYNFFIKPGSYVVCVAAVGYATLCQQVLVGPTLSGNNNFTGANSFTSINSVFWAGPGLTPTIDQAVASCGSDPCVVQTSPTYSGAESSNLTTATGSGYKYYSGGSQTTILDLRGSNDPTINYPIKVGGKTFANYARLGVTQYCDHWTDASCVGVQSNAVVSGVVGSGGTQTGLGGLLFVTGANLDNTANQVFVGVEGYVGWQPTGGSVPNADEVYGFTGSANMDTTTAVGTITFAAGFHAANNTNASLAGGRLLGSYGFLAEEQTHGTNLNYSFGSKGSMLFFNNKGIDALDSGGLPRNFVKFTSADYTVFHPQKDVNGFVFNNQNDTATWMQVNANGVNTPSLEVTGTAASLAGTGACATLANQLGGATAGEIQCTGTTGASTLTITTGITAAHGWTCWGSDTTTAAIGIQTTRSTTAPVLSFASVTANDVLTFGCVAY